MDSLLIRGGNSLRGEATVIGGKNNSLPILAAAALAADTSVIENVPMCLDVLVMCEILRALGCAVEVAAGGQVTVDASSIANSTAPAALCHLIRGSYYVAGMLLARVRQFEAGMPGGDVIGSKRPVDFHIKGFQALGATVRVERGYFVGSAQKLAGAEFFVPRQSVGTTINMLLAASLAEGTTVLQNAAREPEVTDTAVFLNSMGARIHGAGTPTIVVDGVKSLHGVRYPLIPDRSAASTYLVAGAATSGDVRVAPIIPEHITALLSKLRATGCRVEVGLADVRVRGPQRLATVDIETAPHPGFPTDLQPPFVAMLGMASGEGVIRETVYEGRFGYVDELVRMGADIRVEGETAYVRGVDRLSGGLVQALDIRGGAAVVIAGLMAEGTTEVSDAENIDRGYEALERTLRDLGADIRRVSSKRESVLASPT